MRKHPEIKGYRLIIDYPGNRRPLGTFEPYTSGDFSRYVYHEDILRDKKLKQLGIDF